MYFEIDLSSKITCRYGLMEIKNMHIAWNYTIIESCQVYTLNESKKNQFRINPTCRLFYKREYNDTIQWIVIGHRTTFGPNVCPSMLASSIVVITRYPNLIIKSQACSYPLAPSASRLLDSLQIRTWGGAIDPPPLMHTVKHLFHWQLPDHHG